MMTCTPREICLYLAWSDRKGKTAVHDSTCPEIGIRQPRCSCPRRLAHGTLQVKISQLKSIFQSINRSGSWDSGHSRGNPVDSKEVAIYTQQILVEQSKGHCMVKQAKPVFLPKLTLISMYIDRELLDLERARTSNRSLRSFFVLARDQALFKLMFFGGDRASDAGTMLCQEIKTLPDQTGYMIRHTWGKTSRSSKPNIFTLFRSENDMICPVKGLERYIAIGKNLNTDLTVGYLFRPLGTQCTVLDQPVSHAVIHDRLKFYLATLGIYEGETPHSLRAGCAITLRALSQAQNEEAIMDHVGWRSSASAQHYTRSATRDQAKTLSSAMAHMEDKAPLFVEDTVLPHSFT